MKLTLSPDVFLLFILVLLTHNKPIYDRKVDIPLNTDAAIIQETQTSNWLQKLKEESWEAELLLYAIAMFGTFQLFDAVA